MIKLIGKADINIRPTLPADVEWFVGPRSDTVNRAMAQLAEGDDVVTLDVTDGAKDVPVWHCGYDRIHRLAQQASSGRSDIRFDVYHKKPGEHELVRYMQVN